MEDKKKLTVEGLLKLWTDFLEKTEPRDEWIHKSVVALILGSKIKWLCMFAVLLFAALFNLLRREYLVCNMLVHYSTSHMSYEYGLDKYETKRQATSCGCPEVFDFYVGSLHSEELSVIEAVNYDITKHKDWIWKINYEKCVREED